MSEDKEKETDEEKAETTPEAEAEVPQGEPAPEAAPEADPGADGVSEEAFGEAGEEEAEEEEEAEAEEEAEEEDFEAVAAELKDKLLRAMAEAENVRRRAEREKESASKYAIANFAREMLRVNDNLRRAMESVDEEARKESEAVENLFVGIEMTEREMLNALERVGIKAIDAMGQRFDPNLHEAMFEVEDKEQPAGTVVQVMETGYQIYDRPLRPARVAVSKGGPKAEAPESKLPESQPEGPAVYEKQVDAEKGPSGSQVDEEL